MIYLIDYFWGLGKMIEQQTKAKNLKVKVLADSNSINIDKLFNEWLDKQDDNVVVQDIQYRQSSRGGMTSNMFSVLIVYSEN
jgi:hypothetical protein